MNERFCAQCGSALDGNGGFCGNCGAPVPEHSQPPAEELPQQPFAATSTDGNIELQPVKPAKKVKSIRRHGGIAFLSFVLSFALFLSLFSGLFLFGLRLSVTEQGCKDLIKDLITDDELLQMPAAEMTDADSEGTVSAYIIESIREETDDELDIDEESLKEFLEESCLVELFCEIIGSSVSEAVTGINETSVGTKELRQALKKDRKLIEKCFGVELKNDEIDAVVEEIEESGMIEDLEKDLAIDIDREITDITQKAFGAGTVLTVLLAAAGLILLICLLNRFNIVFIGKDVGAAAVWAGGFLCIPSAVFAILQSSLSKEPLMKLVIALVDGVLGKLLITGLITVVIGIALIVTGAVIKKQIKKQTA